MDHSFGAEKEHNLEHDLTEFAQIPFRCANDYEICAKQSEYAFDISNYWFFQNKNFEGKYKNSTKNMAWKNWKW